MIFTTDASARTLDGTRSYAALRGNVRDRIDREVCLHRSLSGYGIGRSSFIAASLDLFMGLDDIDPASWPDDNGETLRDRFIRVALMHEEGLPR